MAAIGIEILENILNTQEVLMEKTDATSDFLIEFAEQQSKTNESLLTIIKMQDNKINRLERMLAYAIKLGGDES